MEMIVGGDGLGAVIDRAVAGTVSG
jgi:hypothetical protein